jgi:hypothetical protein
MKEKSRFEIELGIQAPKIQPTKLIGENLSREARELVVEIIECCQNSGLNFLEINKSLHLADAEIYRRTLTKKGTLSHQCPRQVVEDKHLEVQK